MTLYFQDVTVACTSAASNVEASARETGAAAEVAAKYKPTDNDMRSQLVFHPIAVETQGPLNESARDLLSDVGRRIALCSGDDARVPSCFNEFQLSCSGRLI